MNQQSANKYVWWLLGLVAVEILSLAGFWLGQAMAITFWLLVLAGVWLAIRRPYWLALASLAELVIGGKGYLFFVSVAGFQISIRMALFGLVLSATLISVIRARKSSWPDWWRPVGVLVLWVGFMAGWGLLRGYLPSEVYRDANAFLYLLLLPAWWWNFRQANSWKADVMNIVLAGATIVAVKSWMSQLLFAQEFSWIRQYYLWIRQTGIGEITFISDNVYRIFFQSQIYVVLVWCATFSAWVWGQAPRWWVWPYLASALGIYISLSRSFWLGVATILVMMIGVLIRNRAWRRLSRMWLLIPTAAFVWLASSWALNFPYVISPVGAPQKGNVTIERLRSEASRQASNARVNQISPLWQSIRQQPIIGQGFGATVTYFSTDPRVRGWRTTSAFELGYLDLWLKIGVIGLGLYTWWLLGVFQRLRRLPYWPVFLFGTLALIVIHLTTPYLNHPLGLGWLMLVTLMAYE